MNNYQLTEIKTLLSDCLYEKPGSYLMEELFQRFPTPPELMEATEQQLIQIKGIGMGKARQIMALLQLTRALSRPTQTPYIIRSPRDVFELLAPELRYVQQEHFICLFLNTKNHLIFKDVISIG